VGKTLCFVPVPTLEHLVSFFFTFKSTITKNVQPWYFRAGKNRKKRSTNGDAIFRSIGTSSNANSVQLIDRIQSDSRSLCSEVQFLSYPLSHRTNQFQS
jgi:hypothetical protein